MSNFKLYQRTEGTVRYVGTFDAPEKAMGHADAYSEQTYPEWEFHCKDLGIWVSDEWVIVPA